MLASSEAPPSPAGFYDEISQQWNSGVTNESSATLNARRSPDRLNTNRSGATDVLILTQKFDPHADVVIRELEKAGVETLRLNTEDFLSSNKVMWGSDSPEAASLHDHLGRSIQLSSRFSSFYFRRPLPVSPHPKLLDEAAMKFSASEGEAFIDNLYALSDVRWVSAPHLLRAAEPKIPQLQLAMKLGLRIPRTLVTNSPKEALRFARSLPGDIAVKALKTASVHTKDIYYSLYTRRMSFVEFEKIAEAVEFTPCILQEYVLKDTEYRVTIIGQDLFAVELSTQSVPDAKIDWREADTSAIRHSPVNLHPELQGRLHKFLSYYRLGFGAIDLLRTTDGEFVFLENNPNGVWYWLELETGLPMAASMVRLLTQGST